MALRSDCDDNDDAAKMFFCHAWVRKTLWEDLMRKNIKKQYGASFSEMRERKMRLQSGKQS